MAKFTILIDLECDPRDAGQIGMALLDTIISQNDMLTAFSQRTGRNFTFENVRIPDPAKAEVIERPLT